MNNSVLPPEIWRMILKIKWNTARKRYLEKNLVYPYVKRVKNSLSLWVRFPIEGGGFGGPFDIDMIIRIDQMGVVTGKKWMMWKYFEDFDEENIRENDIRFLASYVYF